MKKFILEANRKFWTGYEKFVQGIAIVLAIVVMAALECFGVYTGYKDDDFLDY